MQKLGSLIYLPRTHNSDASNNNSSVLCSFWGNENNNNISLKTTKKGVYVLYELLDSSLFEPVGGVSFMEIMTKYSAYNLDFLSTTINMELLDSFAVSLNNIQSAAKSALLKKPPQHYLNEIRDLELTQEEFATFINHLQTYYKILDSVTKSISIYKEYMALKEAAQSYEIAYDILYNPVLLEEYLNDLNKVRPIQSLDMKTSLSISPKLKPVIRTYVEFYGWPEKGAFDNEKMGKIIAQNIV